MTGPTGISSGRTQDLGTHMMKLRAVAIAGSCLLPTLLAFAAPCTADDYPSRSIRLIIPFAPGGSNDVVGRIIANQLGEKARQTDFRR